MKYAKFIEEKQVIKFISPSFGCTTEPYISRLKKAIEKFEEMGYRVNLGEYCYHNDRGLASTKENLAEEFNEAYLERNSQFLLSIAGGELQNLILDGIDFDRIRSSIPKWFMGYSDNTHLTFLLTIVCDIATIYGPTATNFGCLEFHESLIDALQLMRGQKMTFHNYEFYEIESLKNPEHPYETYNLTEKSIPINTNPLQTKMRGRLIGGCLDVFPYLVGTPFDKVSQFLEKYREDGFIWYFESCDLNSISVLRVLTLLKRNNWFKYIKGFLIGRSFYMKDESYGIKITDAYLESLSEYNVPIIYDLAFGHLKPMFPIINGSIAEVEMIEGHFEIRYLLE